MHLGSNTLPVVSGLSPPQEHHKHIGSCCCATRFGAPVVARQWLLPPVLAPPPVASTSCLHVCLHLFATPLLKLKDVGAQLQFTNLDFDNARATRVLWITLQSSADRDAISSVPVVTARSLHLPPPHCHDPS